MNAPFRSRYDLEFKLYPYARHADQEARAVVRHPVVIVGGGPVGMGLALDLGKRGVPCVVLDDHEGIGAGSRAICFAKRTLEICDRLGCGDPMVEKGVVWNLGRVYRDEEEIYDFNLLPEEGHKRPAFINLQQPYFERFLVEEIRRAQENGAPLSLRGKNRVSALESRGDYARLTIETPDGPYALDADWVIAADGARSPLREMLGLGFEGRVFEDNFLIADIRATNIDIPVERRFWFDPPFNRGETALMHRQPDDVWRLDFQLGWGIDRAAESAEPNVRARVAAMLGDEIDFELVWSSIYTFRCCTMERYVHGPVIFAGDAAHQVSPFGARGANGGMQDIDNLGWKLGLVVTGAAPRALLESYHTERKAAALENIKNSSRSADFLTPRSPAHALFREAVLDLVKDNAFARPMVNSGRLSTPCIYDGSPLNGVDALKGAPRLTRPGAPCLDAPMGEGFLLDALSGGRFQLLALRAQVPEDEALGVVSVPRPSRQMAERYLGDAQSALYLIRPDQHVAARWPDYEREAISEALRRACARGEGAGP
ncbi:MAG: FAD-dependent oxidoreductase [Pseudomonadota bacterium]